MECYMLLLIQGDLHLIIVDPVASDLAKAGPLLHVITSPSDSAIHIRHAVRRQNSCKIAAYHSAIHIRHAVRWQNFRASAGHVES